jgi:hypothetical protein
MASHSHERRARGLSLHLSTSNLKPTTKACISTQSTFWCVLLQPKSSGFHVPNQVDQPAERVQRSTTRSSSPASSTKFRYSSASLRRETSMELSPPVGTVDPLVCWHTAILNACAASASCRRSLSAACHSSVACASPNVPTTRRLRHGVFARKAGKVSYLCSLLLGDALRGLEQPISRAWRWAEPKGFLRRAKLAAVACEASQLAKSLPASISRIRAASG